jgi:hypothetical protein
MHVDAQSESTDLDFVGGRERLLFDGNAIDRGADQTVVVFHGAFLAVEAQGRVAGREHRIVETNHHAGIVADSHLGRGEHHRAAEARVLEEDDLERAARFAGRSGHFLSSVGASTFTVRSRKVSGTSTMLFQSLGVRWNR